MSTSAIILAITGLAELAVAIAGAFWTQPKATLAGGRHRSGARWR